MIFASPNWIYYSSISKGIFAGGMAVLILRVYLSIQNPHEPEEIKFKLIDARFVIKKAQGQPTP